MRIGVISDTHIPTVARAIPADVLATLAGVDLILHAGDLVVLSVLLELVKIAPVKAVYGNMDPRSVVQALPRKLIVEAGPARIGLVHGSGPPPGVIDAARKEFAGEALDVVVFGHSHQALSKRIGDTLYFNPGSPTDQRFSSRRSVGLLEIGEEITGRIVEL